MSRRLRRIEKLFRLRSLEREVASSRLARAMLAERQADEEYARDSAHVTNIDEDHLGLVGADPTVGFLRASNNSRARARAIASIASEAAADRASEATSRRRDEALSAEQRVRSIELLLKRAQAEARREQLRNEQKRIDDLAGRARGLWRRLSFVAVLCCVSATTAFDASAGEETALMPPVLEASFTAVRLRQAEQDRRERELIDRERNLAKLERTVLARLDELEELSELVQSRIETWKEAEGGKSISRLSRIYGVMPPERAAPLVGSLDLELATQIVAKMKPKQSSALLALLELEQARKMSERIAHPLSMEPASVPEEAR